MEFAERVFGFKKRRQEKLLDKLGVSGELKKELIGPNSEECSVARVENDQFLQILKAGNYDKVLVHLVNQSDTHQYHDFYLSIGQGVQLKTGVASLDYGGERNLFSDFHEMSFKYDPKESEGQWSVYNLLKKQWGEK